MKWVGKITAGYFFVYWMNLKYSSDKCLNLNGFWQRKNHFKPIWFVNFWYFDAKNFRSLNHANWMARWSALRTLLLKCLVCSGCFIRFYWLYIYYRLNSYVRAVIEFLYIFKMQKAWSRVCKQFFINISRKCYLPLNQSSLSGQHIQALAEVDIYKKNIWSFVMLVIKSIKIVVNYTSSSRFSQKTNNTFQFKNVEVNLGGHWGVNALDAVTAWIVATAEKYTFNTL